MSLKINQVSKSFLSKKTVLENITLEIKDGEFVCVTGPSGCGKTTLLNIISGLEKPSCGEVLLDDNIIVGAGSDRVVMFQESALFPWLTVIGNIKFGLKIAGKSKQEQEATALRYLELVRLTQFKDYRIHELSGGMKQRVALARALALDSKILLMDEPFASLDKQTKNKLRDDIQEIWMQAGKTVIFITHSIEEAVFFADRVIMLSANPGKIVSEFEIDLPRPRHIDDFAFIALRSKLLSKIRNEVEKSVEQEYDYH